jgi:hypothetical protein
MVPLDEVQRPWEAISTGLRNNTLISATGVEQYRCDGPSAMHLEISRYAAHAVDHFALQEVVAVLCHDLILSETSHPQGLRPNLDLIEAKGSKVDPFPVVDYRYVFVQPLRYDFIWEVWKKLRHAGRVLSG